MWHNSIYRRETESTLRDLRKAPRFLRFRYKSSCGQRRVKADSGPLHPDEAPIRKLMYELLIELRRKKAVANQLNRLGWRTRKGSKFGAETVGRLLQDPTAKGMHRTNYTKRTDDDASWELKPESEWVLDSGRTIGFGSKSGSGRQDARMADRNEQFTFSPVSRSVAAAARCMC